jgi:putative oxidoreductase
MALEHHAAGGEMSGRIGAFAARVNSIIRTIAHPALTQLVLRLGLAVPFWRSGINKWNGLFELNDVAVLLFSTEFKLHLPGGPYAFPAPEVMAHVVASAEILLPILLVLGLLTRLAASTLLLMTLIIQLTVPSGWPVHITWAAMALALMAWGPSRLSVDHLLALVSFSPRERGLEKRP